MASKRIKYDFEDEDLQPDNLNDEEIAKKVFAPKSSAEASTSSPDMPMTEDRQQIKKDILEMITLPILSPASYLETGMKPEKGVLLFGLPGTGKSKLVTSLFDDCTNKVGVKITCFRTSGPDILNGNPINNLKKLFARAETLGPSVVFVDEVDDLFANRSMSALKFLELMDGVKADGTTFFIAATNRIDVVDRALLRPGRFEATYELHLPPLKERTELLELLTSKGDVTQVSLKDAAAKAKEFSPADLSAVCRKAMITALKRKNPSLQGHPSTWVRPFDNSIVLIPSDIEQALAGTTASCYL